MERQLWPVDSPHRKKMAGHDWLQTPSQPLFSKAKAQGVLTPALKGPLSHEKYPKRYDATFKVKCYFEQSLTPAL